jgi:hypothetical protein
MTIVNELQAAIEQRVPKGKGILAAAEGTPQPAVLARCSEYPAALELSN